MPRSPQRSRSLRLPHQNPVHTYPFPHTCYMPRPSQSSRFYHPHDITLQKLYFRTTPGTVLYSANILIWIQMLGKCIQS
jgi:hypothetical protein